VVPTLVRTDLTRNVGNNRPHSCALSVMWPNEMACTGCLTNGNISDCLYVA